MWQPTTAPPTKWLTEVVDEHLLRHPDSVVIFIHKTLLYRCLIHNLGRRRMSTQLIHNAIDGLHIPGIDLVVGIAIRQMLDQLIQGGLVVADGGGDGVDGFFARGGGGIGGGHFDEGWEDV